MALADFNKRLWASICVLITVAFLIAFSSNPVVQLVLVACVAALAAIGVWEYVQLLRHKSLELAQGLMITFAILEVIAFFASIYWVDWPLLPVVILFIAAVSFFIFHFRHPPEALARVAAEFFGVCYIAVPLSFMLGILYPVSQHATPQEGRWWLVYLIFVTKMTDIGGYFFGQMYGKHKLAPILSPKKTVEGAVAGFLCAVLASVFMHFLGLYISHGTFALTLFESVWLGMIIGIVGQVGDLAESLLKRDAEVKDSNRLPGFGGVLDMVDSLLFSAPFVYFLIRMH